MPPNVKRFLALKNYSAISIRFSTSIIPHFLSINIFMTILSFSPLKLLPSVLFSFQAVSNYSIRSIAAVLKTMQFIHS